jgi:hypothetical protein
VSRRLVRCCLRGRFAASASALHRFARVHLDLLEGIVREGMECGQFKIGDQRPRDIATQIAASVQGALLVSRITSDPHILDEVVGWSGTISATHTGTRLKLLK